MMDETIFVAGAGGALGFEIVRLLRKQGARVVASYRTPRPGVGERLEALGAIPRRIDFDDPAALQQTIAETGAAIFTPILTTSRAAASMLRSDQRAVFFSSNNVAIDPQAEVYARLLAAEADVLAAAPGAVVLRPTMIYGYAGDGNLSRLMAAMRRSPFIPLPGGGRALQQPVYYADLARFAVETLAAPPSARITAVAGPEAMTQRALYAAAARAAGAQPRVFSVPTGVFASLVGFCQRLGLRLPVSTAQLRRAGLDKTPQGPDVVLADTPLEQGLKALAAALDAEARGA